MTKDPAYHKTWHQLCQLRHQKKIPHALLLYGIDEDGLASLARDFSQIALCLTPESDKACGRCRACLLGANDSHPDYVAVGDEKGASIDEVRGIAQFLQQTAHQGGYQVVFLNRADRLLPGAANALLKLLEEPAGETVFLLTARHPKGLMPTLRSRCFALAVPAQSLPGDDAIGKNLVTVMREGVNSWFDQEELRRFVSDRPPEALYFIYYWVADLIRAAAMGTGSSSIPRTVTVTDLYAYWDRINEALSAVHLPGVNKPLLFESLLIQWHQLISGEA